MTAPAEPATGDPAADFAALMSGLLPSRPADPAPADEPVPADVVDDTAPRRPRPDMSQASGANNPPVGNPADTFAAIIASHLPGGRFLN